MPCACILAAAVVGQILAYCSSQITWVSGSPEVHKHCLPRNSWTGDYSYGK